MSICSTHLPFAEQDHDPSRCVIIDSSFDERLSINLYQLEPQSCPDWHPLFQDTPYATAQDAGPVLVRCPEDNSLTHYLSAQLQQTDAGCVLWLDSDHDLTSAATHCRSLLSADTENGHRLLRFYEPRWLEPLLSSLSATELTAFMGPFRQLAWRNELGWRQCTRPLPWEAPIAEPGWFRLDQERQADIQRTRLKVLAQHMSHNYQIPTEAEDPTTFIHRQLVAAQQFGHVDSEELERWLRLSLKQGDGFWDKPDAQTILNRRGLSRHDKLSELERLSA